MMGDIMRGDKTALDDETSLLEAAKSGETEKVKALLDKGVDIESCDAQGRTPLYLAAKFNHAELLKYLIQNNANIYVRKKDGTLQTAFHVAIYTDSLEALKTLVSVDQKNFIESKNSNGHTPLFHAAYCVSPNCAAYLIEKKADVTVINDQDMTMIIAAIHATTLKNYGDVLKLLTLFIKMGVDVNHQQTLNHKDTALVAAASRGMYEAVELLLNSGARVDTIAGPNNGSALSWSTIHGDLAMTRLLVNYGADVNLGCDFYGVDNATPLFHLIYGMSKDPFNIFKIPIDQQRRLEIADFLVRSGADIDQMSNNCINALGIAAYLGKVEMVKFLLNCGAMTEVTCSFHDYAGTPSEIAEARTYQEVVAVIKSHQANLNAKILAYTHELQVIIDQLSIKAISLEAEVRRLVCHSEAQKDELSRLSKSVSLKNEKTLETIQDVVDSPSINNGQNLRTEPDVENKSIASVNSASIQLM